MKRGGIANPAFEPSSPDLRLKPRASVSRPRSPPGRPPPECEEGPCGWGSFTPRALQLCNNPEGYLSAYSLLAVFQGIVVNGLVNVSISTIEKRFELNSSLTGVISASYDIAFCVLSLFVAFFGERGHKPRWLAFSSFMIGLGSLVFALPHFAAGIYQYGSKLEDTCQVSGTSNANFTCNTSKESSLSNYLYVFILAQLLLGVGGTPLYTLGTAFIDDSVPKHKSSLYIGIGYAMSLLGPALGYVLGGQLLNIYIDVPLQTSTEIDPDDPRWLGAWWIAFLLCCFGTWLLIIPFSCFPKHLPGTAKVQSEKISEAHDDGSEAFVEDRNIGKNFKDFPVALLILLKNPVLMCLIVAASTEALVATGFATFLPKFIENQFGQSSSYSATLGGIILIPGAALGQVISGILVSKYKLDCKNIIKFILGTCSVALLLNTVFMFSKCGNEPFAGVSETYNGTGKLQNLTAPCNANCNCLRSFYYPVCGRDEVQYFSPCFAGCTSFTDQKRKKTYQNCSCIGMPKRLPDSEEVPFEALAGKCRTQCTFLPLFLGFFFFAVVFTFMAVTPTTVAIFRCVPDKQRSFALGVQSVFLRLVGTIPGPILFGVAIDSTCTLWDVNKCDIKGACWVYDNSKMAYMLIGISAACKVITILFIITAFCLYKPPPDNSATLQKDAEMVSAVHM
ncbi:solute carrier organic anion transporter family member 4C1-like [Trachemys scripta elegans]|uniref:solute carrier organic anion transporter family member 4C1-like n=1 Tax=Trachemys scripta elegans TaxID=31138 RepID=UPI0015528C48|nr:solute carrier organic anion transporter family member 4C1-like [Trachemys scripta elegans]